MARSRHQGTVTSSHEPRPLPELPPESELPDAANHVIQPDVARVLLNSRVIRELSRETPGFNRSGLLADLFNEWGSRTENGQAAFAKSIYVEFNASKPGSIARQRILDMMCKLINWHSDDVHIKPVDEMTEDDLVSAITASIPRLERVLATPEPSEDLV